MKRLCLLYKVLSTKQPSYIHNLPPPMRSSSQHSNTFNTFSCGTEQFRNSFLPSTASDWNMFEPDIRDSNNYSIFHISLLKFIRPAERKTYHINNSSKIKLFSYLCEHLN